MGFSIQDNKDNINPYDSWVIHAMEEEKVRKRRSWFCYTNGRKSWNDRLRYPSFLPSSLPFELIPTLDSGYLIYNYVHLDIQWTEWMSSFFFSIVSSRQSATFFLKPRLKLAACRLVTSFPAATAMAVNFSYLIQESKTLMITVVMLGIRTLISIL